MKQRVVSLPRFPDLKKETIARRRRRLPHWEADGAAYFITFRLADSLPDDIRDRESEMRVAMDRHRALGQYEQAESFAHELFKFSEKHLHEGMGSCVLTDSHVARVVWNSLFHFDGERHDLYAACLMPNHVHVVTRLLEGRSLKETMHSWKGFTSSECNRLLGRKGAFWEPEYFDHMIRSGHALERFSVYTERNPEFAGLRRWPWTYRAIVSLDDPDVAGKDARATWDKT